jgi:hypothetical protein
MILASAGSTSGAKWARKAFLWQPGEALIVGADMCQRGRRLALAEQGADGFALVEPETGHVDKSDNVRSVRAQGGHDLATVGMGGDDRGPVLEGEHLTQPCHVVRQGREGDLTVDARPSSGRRLPRLGSCSMRPAGDPSGGWVFAEPGRTPPG